MVVGVCTVAIHLPLAHSLKEKRRVLKGLKDRLRARHNLAVAEVDCQDLWQRAVLGIVTVSESRGPAESVLQAVLREIETAIPGEITERQLEFL